MINIASLVSFLWLGWLVSWLLAARWTGATRSRGSAIDQLRYGVPTWIGAILLFSSPRFPGSLLDGIFPKPAALDWTAVCVILLGLLWTWWARIHLGRLWSATVAVKEDHTLVCTGPYRLTRHPIYTGLLLALLATAFLRDSWAGFAGWALLAAGFVIKLQQEEKLLLATFGSAYARYQSKVPALIPCPK